MSSSRYPIVVQGEASETDSDDEVYITSLTSHQTTAGGAKVPGEASETDSEDDPQQAVRSSVMAQESAQILKRELPPLIVVRDNPDVQSIVDDRPSPSHKPYAGDTLLQQKLLESNSRLYTDVGQRVRQVYGSASPQCDISAEYIPECHHQCFPQYQINSGRSEGRFREDRHYHQLPNTA
ncbi:biogenesis of lysosome-related organelles complex 1 subunit 3 isoform X3 [Xiphophorus hellerii]|uniref:biogenesis of lysosome-related organelles complex 1 subunit 3 isoform X3 n=1 Tax=Xiphophorus hellerii TaxID=8084 RepID=UPI0013B36815|nr:biogenesis of lysosome-related organelles complex 1 subunit 3 isoform X3 [Xiphophorus hellerii]